MPAASGKHKIAMSRGDKVFIVINYLFLTMISLLILYPLIYVLSSSFSSPQAVTQGKVLLLPVEPTLLGYRQVFKNPNVLSGYWNSIVLTTLGTTVNIVLTVMLAYPLSVRDFAGKKLFTALITFTMLFGGGLVPTFILVNNLGLYNTIWALILPGLSASIIPLLPGHFSRALSPTTFMNQPPWTAARISAISSASSCPCPRLSWRYWSFTTL